MNFAKLYFKAGRFDECRSECEDIKLWFGRGEIVERAKRLIASIDDDEQFVYIDDRDYTIEKDIPNPEDTGSARSYGIRGVREEMKRHMIKT